MGKGIKHTNVGAQLTQEEFESETSHYLASGTSFPASPSEGDLFYRTDEHKWYIYNGTAWSLLTGDPTKVAGQASGLREEHGFSSQSLAAGAYGDVTVTFAVAFSNAPTVLVGFCYPNNTLPSSLENAAHKSSTTTNFVWSGTNQASGTRTIACEWLAIGE